MKDRYTNPEFALSRLEEEYKKHKKLIVAVDFDDTVYDFHKKGDTHERVLGVIRKCRELGFYIVLFTGAVPERYPEQDKFFLENGIMIDSINQNPIPLPFGNHGKVYYNILLDDRAGLGEACEILEILVGRIEQRVYND